MWGVTTPAEATAKIEEQKAEAVARMKEQGVTEPRNLEEQAQLLIGKDIYEALIKGYTEKQWGRKCTELPAFIIKRLPVRLVFDNNYFNDKYQGIPIGGYNKLIDGLLDNVECHNNIDFFDLRSDINNDEDGSFTLDASKNTALGNKTYCFGKMVFTGQIDEFYDYKYGKLNFRTVRFEQDIIDKPNYQGNAVINYTEAEVPYTRVIEHKHFEMFGQKVYDCKKTVISKEYSTEWKDGMEPYYPVNDNINNELAEKYRTLAAKESNVIFGGRLAEYKYYDMAPVVENVMKLFK
jgi:UDP-galactopyranose mutase